MCKLAIAINNTNKRNKKFEDLIQMQFAQMRHERDGCAALVIGQNGEMQVRRVMNESEYSEIFDWTRSRFDDAKLIAIHTRTGTSGTKDLTNVHFFQHGDQLFAHNGFVGKFHTSDFASWRKRKSYGEGGFGFYSSVPKAMQSEMSFTLDTNISTDFSERKEAELQAEISSCNGCNTARRGYCKRHKEDYYELMHLTNEDQPSEDDDTEIVVVKTDSPSNNSGDAKSYCDSFQFLQTLKKNANADDIRKHIEDTSFTGMGMLVNEKTKDIHLLIQKTCYVVTDNKTYVGMFSYEPNLERVERYKEVTTNVCGITTIVRDGMKRTIKISDKPKKMVEGVYKMDISKIK